MLRLGIVLLAVGTVGTLMVAAVLGSAATASAAGNPDAAGVSCAITADGDASAARVSDVDLSAEQMHNAQLIVAVVAARRLPERAAEIALMTAMQESSLIDVEHGDAAGPDSLGLFQQRMSWGPASARLDPRQATGLFLDRLVRIPDWQVMDPAHAAHLVQRNKYEDDYRKWIGFSRALGTALYGSDPTQVSCSGGRLAPGASPNARTEVALKAAASMLGRPYCYDGGDSHGPTHGDGGPGCPDGTVGFDCSGLTLYAWAQSGIALPHFSGAQYTYGRKIPITQVRPGDLVFLANATEGNHHVAMIWSVDQGTTTGSGQIIEAQDYNVPVHIRKWIGVNEPEVLPYAVRLAG